MAATSPSDIAKEYARHVVAGKVPAGEYVRLACLRFLRNLISMSDKKYTYEMNGA
ncbi:hypothetical protein [Xanthomonas oryzae]|uniref:hypothetical protein n=1 Tax=Xanthomonas oryzae TaxID=347 RepID=UPI0013EF9FBD|nr:hypothetical protein [Xanthomonas oryzae]